MYVLNSLVVNCEWWTQSLSFIIMYMYTHVYVCEFKGEMELNLFLLHWSLLIELSLFFVFYYIALVHRKKGKYFFFDKQVNFFCSSNQHVVGSTRRIENKLTKNLYPKQVHMYKRTLIAYTINYIPNSLVQVYTSRWMG